MTALSGTTVLEAAGRANIIIETPCGGNGTCGQCKVIIQDADQPNENDKAALSPEEIAKGVRLACHTEINRDMTIEVPASSRFLGQRILAEGISRDCPLEPCVVLDSSDKIGLLHGAAFDIGTTTIVGALLDLSNGKQVAVSSRANPQIPLGDDVIARISHAGRDGGLKLLRKLVLDCVNEMIAEMCKHAGIQPTSVYEVTFVGNTTMNHILLGINPSQLAQAPYHAVLLESRRVSAQEMGINIRPSGHVYTMANIAGFVGGDTVGMILAAAMHEYDGIQLALDIGTNGEIVLGGKNRLIACSTAAGPAFEGARIKHGMRASSGAIEKVFFDGDVHIHVIGNKKPRGLCGSGVLDTLAALIDAGIVDETGRLLPPDELPASVPDKLKRRVVELDGQRAFVLTGADESGREGPVIFTQRDIREVQLGKAAIYAGTKIMLREYGVPVDGVHRILLAGAFGNYVRARSVIRIGLLPQVPESRVEFIGNAAGTGARMVLAGRTCRATSEQIARQTEYVELAGRPDFQMEFAEAMAFPLAQ